MELVWTLCLPSPTSELVVHLRLVKQHLQIILFSSTDSANFQSEKTSTCSGRHLTRVERARLEALQAFGGSGLQDVMTSSKRKVACNLEEKNDVAAEDSDSQIGNKENFDGCGEQVPVQ